MMRILILANNDVGLYKFRKELLEELHKNHYEVFASLPAGEFEEQIKALGCTYIETDINRRGTNPFEDLKLYGKYKKMMREIKPDLVLTYTIKPNVYGGMACQKYKIPYIVNVTGLGSALENGGALQQLTKQMYKAGLKKANMVFLQNEENLNFMKKNGVLSGPYDLIPGSGVNTSQYAYCDYPKEEMIHFVFVGRMMKEKGFELYLDCAKQIHDKYPNTLFHICGIKEENYYERVRQLSEEGVCYYHGLVDDMKEIYSQVHCVIHPTYYPEGMSNVLLEASACGRPVITTNRAGCREIVDDGINGFIVEQKNLNDLVEKVEKFLSLSNKEKEQLGKNGRKKVEQQFDRKIVVRKYMDEIRKLEK